MFWLNEELSIPRAYSTAEAPGIDRTAEGKALWKAEAASEVKEATSDVAADTNDAAAEVTELMMSVTAGAGAGRARASEAAPATTR